MMSPLQAVTSQFYEWERRGRGWYKADFPVDLEPPFYPFFGHYVPGNIIDDGKQPTWLSAIGDMFKTQSTSCEPPCQEHPIQAYPYTDDAPLTIYTIMLPRQFKQHTERIEQLLIMLAYRKSPISFEIITSEKEIALQFVCREPDEVFVYTQLHAFFPECTIREAIGDRVLELFETELPLYTVDFGLQEEFMRPLAMYPTLDHEPLRALFGILSRLQNEEYIIVQILFSGTHHAWAESIMTAVCDESGKQSFFFDAPEMPLLAKEKTTRPLFGVSIRILALAETLHDAATLLQDSATAIIHASTSANNQLLPLSTPHYSVEERMVDILLRTSRRVGMLLNSKELITFVHFPSLPDKKLFASNRTTKIAPTFLTGSPYELGINEHQGVELVVSLPREQRLKHIHLIGATGTGKSTLLHSLIMQDIYRHEGICVLDPHGDLIDTILAAIPQNRIADVVVIDPSDSAYPIGFNILCAHSDLEKELLASDLVAVFKRFSTSWGDQMNSVFANAIMAFVYNSKQYHLGDLRRFLIEQPYRAHILATVSDPDIVYYWQKEFPILKSTSIGPILTRLDAFLRPKVIRNMVCQTQSLNFQELMDSKKIVLVKLSQGLLGMENSYLLGALIVSKLQQTAMSRQSQQAKDRIPFYCYIDEFHHFITPSMEAILSGARKYALGLVLAHQDMQQVSKYDTEIANSLLSNAGTRICFRLGDTDAKRLQDGFAGFSADDLLNLNTGEAIARVNTADADFNLAVIPYSSDNATHYTTEIIEHSRKHYSVSIELQSIIVQKSEGNIKASALTTPLVHIKSIPVSEDAAAVKQETVREHRYLQTFVKALAEAQGYKASVEVPTPDGKGMVDVLLAKATETIAIEISVTTGPEWELHNIRKCLAAGYSKIVVCTSQLVKLKHIQHLVVSQLTEQEQSKVTVMMSADIPTLFVAEQQPQKAETRIKGYRVKVNYEPNATRQDLLQSIVNVTRKR